MHAYENILKKSSAKLESGLKKRGLTLPDFDFATFIQDLIQKFLNCGKQSVKESIEESPRWSRAIVMLTLQNHSPTRIKIIPLRAMAEAVIEEIKSASDEDLMAAIEGG